MKEEREEGLPQIKGIGKEGNRNEFGEKGKKEKGNV